VLQSGNLFDALRATMSIPGLFAPARIKDRWLVDGGLVDPVPVGVARAIEADVVIAVDLNSRLISPRKRRRKTSRDEKKVEAHREHRSQLVQRLANFYESAGSEFRSRLHDMLDKDSSTPDIIETVTTSIGIMQERITRINLAVEPPDVLLQPRLGGLKMLDFDHVEQSIEEGYLAARRKIHDVKNLLEPA
jgi:NTE family protein